MLYKIVDYVKKMKVLILSANYPTPEVPIGLMYVHTRNLYYKESGMEVTVINFTSDKSYSWEGITVLCLDDYYKQNIFFDILVVHAPNIRQHYKFIKKNEKKFKKIVFFFHGHEVLWRRKTYSEPYWYMKKNRVKTCIDDIYDFLKLKIWHRYLPQIAYKSHFVFVSRWMLNEFKKWVGLNEADLRNHVSITYNSIGQNFEKLRFDRTAIKKYDFITVRGFLDGSKYAVDIVCELAKAYPKYTFLVIGKGEFFKYFEKTENIIWKKEYCSHQQIVQYLNESSCALMPTRTDAQGLMACEMATFGIPLITSDIPVCHEIFDDFLNVTYISNDSPIKDFERILYKVKQTEGQEINKKYYARETVKCELDLFKQLMS